MAANDPIYLHDSRVVAIDKISDRLHALLGQLDGYAERATGAEKARMLAIRREVAIAGYDADSTDPDARADHAAVWGLTSV